MRLLIVCGIFPPDIGGPARYVPLLATELVKRGHVVTVITLGDDAELANPYPFRVIKIRRGIFFPLRILRTIFAVIAEAQRSDIVLANTLGFEASLGCYVARKRCLHKVVGDYAWERARTRGWYHGTIDGYQGAPRTIGLHALDMWRDVPLQLAHAIIVPSIYLARIAAGWRIGRKHVVTIYNAVEHQHHRVEKVARQNKVVVTVCRLVPWKGVEGIISALNVIGGVELRIVGDGPSRNELESLVEQHSLGKRVEFLGSLTPEAVSTELASADLFVLNSTYEGLPHVVLEAMAAGVPVIATDVGGTAEIVHHMKSGILIRPGDRNQLVLAMNLVLRNDRLAAGLIQGANELLEGQFSLCRMIDQTEGLMMDAVRCARTV